MEESSHVQILTEPVTSAACPKCGAMLEIPDIPAFTLVQCPTCEFEFAAPATFGSFLLLQILGMGGMGGVYRARDEALNREVAIKVMLKSLGDDPQFVETFQREAQAAAKLNHSNIGQIYSFGQVMGQPYIAMELIPGGSLDKMMAAQGPLDPGVVFHIGAQIAEGLSEAADANLVHGDVKPENILFDAEKNAKLVDFGLAAMQTGPNREVWGTPYYIAPEKVRKQKTDFRSDIYSLGATLYHAIAGVPPFDGPNAAEVVKARFNGDPKPLRSLRGNAVPEEVETVISRMLSADPMMRYPTYGSLLGDMRRYLSKAGPVSVASSGKKIMIKGKRPKAIVPSASASLPEGMVPVDPMGDLEESEQEGRRRGRKILGLVFLSILLLAGAVVGGFFGIKHFGETKRKKAEDAKIAKSQNDANASIAKSLSSETKKLAERISASVPEAMKIAGESAVMVAAVLGEDVRAWMVPPEPSYDVKPPPAAPPDVAETNKAAEAAGDAAKPTEDEGEQEATAETVAVEPAADADEEPEEAKKYPVVKMVREMYMEAYSVKKADALAKSYIAEIEAMAEVAKKLQAPEQSVKLVEQANAIVAKVNAMLGTRELLEAQRIVSGMKKTQESVKAQIQSVESIRKNEAADQAAAEKREAEQEKKRLEREAEQAKTEGETEMVREKEKEVIPMLKQLQIREATRLLRTLDNEIKTDGGRNAQTVAMKRIQRIEDFHKYLVEKTPGFKSTKGWAIETADAKTVTVGGKKIAWAEIFESRMEIVAELVNGLVMNIQATKNMGLRARTTLETNAALCLNMFYNDVPTAVERAKQIARQAADNFEPDADIIKQLMPDFFD